MKKFWTKKTQENTVPAEGTDQNMEATAPETEKKGGIGKVVLAVGAGALAAGAILGKIILDKKNPDAGYTDLPTEGTSDPADNGPEE